jgi:hypothetical protein
MWACRLGGIVSSVTMRVAFVGGDSGRAEVMKELGGTLFLSFLAPTHDLSFYKTAPSSYKA